MNNKKSNTIFIVLAIIVFIIAGITSIISVKEGKELKASNAAYMIYINSSDSILNNGISAKAESAKKQADEHKAKLIKYFAISLLLYFALLIMLILLYFSNVKEHENRSEINKE